jgi:hypothetical protein
MAVALRGSASVPAGNPTTGFNVTIDAAVQSGDVLFLAVTNRDAANFFTATVTDNDTGGNTWDWAGYTRDGKAVLYWKRATGSTASKTVTVASAVGSCSGVLKAFSGAIAAPAIPFADIVIESNASANETHAGFTPTLPDSMVCAAVFNYGNDNAVTSLSFATLGATTMTEKTSTGGSDSGCAFGHVLQSGGPAATGALTWAQTDGTTYSFTWSIIDAAATGILACASTRGDEGTGAVSTLSFDGPSVSGTNTLAVVALMTAGTTQVTGITWGGVAMTEAAGANATTSGVRRQIFYLAAPAAGISTVAVTASGVWSRFYGSAQFFIGADQSSPLDTSGNGTGTATATFTGTATTNFADCMVVDTIVNPSNLLALPELQAQWSQLGFDGSYGWGSSYRRHVSASSPSVSWSHSSSADWYWGWASFKPVQPVSFPFDTRNRAQIRSILPL